MHLQNPASILRSAQQRTRMAFVLSRCVGLLALSGLSPISGNAMPAVTGIPPFDGLLPQGKPAQSAPVPQGQQTDPFERRVTVNVQSAPLKTVLDQIKQQTGVRLLYDPVAVRTDRKVTVQFEKLTLREVFPRLLSGTGLIVKTAPSGGIMIVPTETPSGDRPQRDTTNATVPGIVVDPDGRPVPAATVSVTGTTIVVQSDANGKFILPDLSSGTYTLTARALGYQRETRTVKIPTDLPGGIRFVLTAVPNRLMEVVTTATGEQRRIEIGNDITVINADSVLRTMPVTTLSDLLATRVPGLVMSTQSGTPGAPSRIRIRGLSSINSTNDPIVILDGVRMYAAQFSQGQNGSNDRSTNMARPSLGQVIPYVPSSLDQIDPNMIETIEVLKGPSAVALYGTDAANGVIVITSKRGRAGPTTWSLNGTWGQERMPAKWPNNYWMWGHNPGETAPIQCKITSAVLLTNACIQDSLYVYQILNDPATTLLGRGDRATYRGDVRGGVRGLTYALSASVSNTLGLMKMPDADVAALADSGIVPAKWQRRPQASEGQNLQARLESEINERTRVSFTSVFNRTFTRATPLANALVSASQLTPILLANANNVGSTLLQRIPDWRNKVTSRTLRTSNALTLSARPLWDITTTATGGVDLTSRNDLSFLKRGDCFTEFGGTACSTGTAAAGYYNTGQGTAMSSSVNLLATTPIAFGNWVSVRTSVGGNFVRSTTNDMIRNASDLPEGATSGNGAVTITSTERGDDRSTAGVYLEANVGIGNRLFFPLAIRQDAGSGLGQRVRPKFPKLSLSYVLSDEPMFARIPLASYLNTFRVRVAYGQSGVQPAMTSKLRTYTKRNVPVDGTAPVAVQTIASFGNSDLRPELTTEIEGGFDTDLFNDRITLGLTWYRKRTLDALINEDLPPSLGYASTSPTAQYTTPTWQRNIGTVENTGYELSLRTSLLRQTAAQWDVNVSLSRTRNTLLKFAQANAIAVGGQALFGAGGSGLGVVQNRFVEGYPLYGTWVRPITAWFDLDGNGVITASEVQLGDSLAYAGSPSPRFQTSMHHTVTLFRRFTVGATFDYQNGMTQLFAPRNSLDNYLSRVWNDPTVSLATQAYLVAAVEQGTGKQGSAAGYIQTVSTLRFNALSLGYTVPAQLSRRLKARQLRISVQGTNLGLWSNYRGIDPNVNQSMSEFSRDVGTLPTPRVWQLTVGIN